MAANRSSLPWRDRADFRELAVRKCLITYASALTSLFVDKECAIVRSHTSCDSHKYAWSRQHRIERKRLQSFSIRCPLCLMPVTVEILVAKFWLGSQLFVSVAVGTHHPTMHSTLKLRFNGHIVPLVEANDVPLFLLSGRPFVVLPSLCQSLLVDLFAAKISLSPLCIFSTLQSRYRCQLLPYDT